MGLDDDLAAVAAAAERYAGAGEELEGILAAEPSAGTRAYLCAYAGAEPARTWLVLDGDGAPVTSRSAIREAVSIAALCEVAEETAGGGDLSELRAQLVTLRLTEQAEGIQEAEEAALELERAIDAPPRVATPAYLDEIGAATRRLEHALGTATGSPFALAMREALPAVDELAADVERNYKLPLA